MIPNKNVPFDISRRRAQIRSSSMPTERHGEERKLMVDIRVEVLLNRDEMNSLLDPDEKMDIPPADLVFHPETDDFNLPMLEIGGQIRHADGRLVLTGASGTDYEFNNSQIVGNANALKFQTGASGSMTLTFRVDGVDQLEHLAHDVLERDDCMLEFEEEENDDIDPLRLEARSQMRNTDQEEMKV